MYEQEAWVSFSAKWMAAVGMATNTAAITFSVIVIVCFVMFARDSVRFSHSFGSTRLPSHSASSHTDATNDNNNRHKHTSAQAHKPPFPDKTLQGNNNQVNNCGHGLPDTTYGIHPLKI